MRHLGGTQLGEFLTAVKPLKQRSFASFFSWRVGGRSDLSGRPFLPRPVEVVRLQTSLETNRR